MSEVDGFVPVDGRTLRELVAARRAVELAEGELSRACRALVELSEDMKTDAVRRLLERGASSAQVERYEEAYRACREALEAKARELREACARLDDAVRAMAG
jgi:hypothetical protein